MLARTHARPIAAVARSIPRRALAGARLGRSANGLSDQVSVAPLSGRSLASPLLGRPLEKRSFALWIGRSNSNSIFARSLAGSLCPSVARSLFIRSLTLLAAQSPTHLVAQSKLGRSLDRRRSIHRSLHQCSIARSLDHRSLARQLVTQKTFGRSLASKRPSPFGREINPALSA